MDNAIPERQQLEELLSKLNTCSVNHCKLVKMLQEVDDDLRKSVTEFHDLLLDIDKLDQERMSLQEAKIIFSSTEAFKLSFVYYRSFQNNIDMLCSKIFNMRQLKSDHRSLDKMNVVSNESDALERNEKTIELDSQCSRPSGISAMLAPHNSGFSEPSTINFPGESQEPMAGKKSDNLGSGSTSETAHQPTVIDSSSPNDYHSCGNSPSNLNMEGKQSSSQCSSSISVGDNAEGENSLLHEWYASKYYSGGPVLAEEVVTTNKMELQQELSPECGSIADYSLKMSTDLAATQSSSKKRSSSDASFYNALGYGCAREMPFSKELLEKAKGNDFLKKFISVTPTNRRWTIPILPKTYAISSPRLKMCRKERVGRKRDRKSRTSSPANGWDSLNKCSPSIQAPPTLDSYQMNLGNMIDSKFSSPMETSTEKLSAESVKPAATNTSDPVPDSASAIPGSGDELNKGPPLTRSSIDTDGRQFSVTVPDELANSLKPAASLTEELADSTQKNPPSSQIIKQEELSSYVSPDEPMSHDDIEIVYDKMAVQRLSPLDVTDNQLPPAKKPRFTDSGEKMDLSFNVPTMPMLNIPLPVHKNLTDMNNVLRNILSYNGSSTNKLPLPDLGQMKLPLPDLGQMKLPLPDLGQMKLPAIMPYSFFNPVSFNQRQDIAAPGTGSVLNGINWALSQLPQHLVPNQNLGQINLASTLKIVPNSSNGNGTDGGTRIVGNAINVTSPPVPKLSVWAAEPTKNSSADKYQAKANIAAETGASSSKGHNSVPNTTRAASTTEEPEIITIED